MGKALFLYVCLVLGIGVGGSVYDTVSRMAMNASHAYRLDQLSYDTFTKAMTKAKPKQFQEINLQSKERPLLGPSYQ